MAFALIFAQGFALSKGQAAHSESLPDLVPILSKPMNGEVTVKNLGTGEAGPSRLTLDCQKEGAAPESGGCPDLPPEFASAYFDPAFPMNATIKVPALAPGATFKHTLAFWELLHWPRGKYKFTAIADAAHEINESRRSNNTATSTLTIP